ncbi:hypothetical protein OH76DRAFT_891661 [Lentinus brumalis]|uniref:Uncharacterized protein n=1 Tax=Lentinus brumalis TaxID=2498619 RepID=A0A371D116_9APHY|nr:hypothetical protein OH76DRAFT_891661 [Polyporus brumalis]
MPKSYRPSLRHSACPHVSSHSTARVFCKTASRDPRVVQYCRPDAAPYTINSFTLPCPGTGCQLLIRASSSNTSSCAARIGFLRLRMHPPSPSPRLFGRPLPAGRLGKSVGEGGKHGRLSELEGAALVVDAGTDKDTHAVMSGALRGTSELRWSTLVAFSCPVLPRLLPLPLPPNHGSPVQLQIPTHATIYSRHGECGA